MKTTRSLKGLVWMMLAALALPLAACDTLLDVTDPDTVNPGTLDDPTFIDVVVTGAIGDFAEAYSGDGLADSYLSVTAAITDEFFSTGTFTTRTATDRRNQFAPANGNTSDGAYVNMQQARRAAMKAAQLVADNPDKGTGDPDYALMKALEGYTYVALGEGYCSSIPISDDTEPDPADGPPRTGAELFQEAVPIFAAVSGDLANVGRARTLVNLGDYATAATAVAGVPTSFNQFVEHSDNADNNPFFSLQSNGRWSISHLEGGNTTGMPFRGATPTDNTGQDPRVPWFEDPAGGFDPTFPLYVTRKYPYRSSPVPFASGIEARLIEAEAALANNDVPGWLGILNTLRADVGNLMAAQIDDYSTWVPSPSLAPLADPGTADSRVDLHFQERAFWLWGTGHRLGDLRRLINQYGRTEAQVFPSGVYHKGGDHGTDVVLPIDFDEVNNTLYDLASCVVADAGFN